MDKMKTAKTTIKNIPADIYEEFRVGCLKRHINVGDTIIVLINRQVEAWRKEKNEI